MTLTVSIGHIMDYIKTKGVVRLKNIPEPSGCLSSNTLPNQHEKIKKPPVTVGVLTTTNKKGLPGGERSRLFKEMVAFGHKRKISIYFFFARDVDWRRRKIRGFVWNGKVWRRGLFPFPDIIYNRIRFRNIESQIHVKRLLRKFERDSSIYLFNSRFLNKWEVYKALRIRKSTAKWLPETMRFNRRTLTIMAKKYPELFLKYNYGSLGKGIIKVRRLGNGHYAHAVAKKGAMTWKKSSSIDSLYRQLAFLSSNAYLVQRGIGLARYKGHIFDLRSQFQKNGVGEWVLTGVAVRVAGKNRFVTHIPNGGRAASYNEVMNEVFGVNSMTKKEIDRQMEEVRVLVPGVLEKELGLSLGVLSMDIGIDKNGRMWIIEVNSKPANFDENDIRTAHWQNLMDYFIYVNENQTRGR
jgi:hypothetical protein